MVDSKLIFDIGLHKGYDAKFYLGKGFKVIGVEASAAMSEFARTDNWAHVADGSLIVVECALFDGSAKTIDFFINPDKDDWGSLDQNAAEKGVGAAQKVTVNTITLDELIAKYGEPYYIKCDIEGGDALFVRSLLKSEARPTFVSIEATSADDLALLLACGYDKFQIVNQYINPQVKSPDPAREGDYFNIPFSHESSALFGRELPPHRWISFTDAMRLFLDWYGIHSRDPNLAIGWLDVHCTRASCV